MQIVWLLRHVRISPLLGFLKHGPSPFPKVSRRSSQAIGRVAHHIFVLAFMGSAGCDLDAIARLPSTLSRFSVSQLSFTHLAPLVRPPRKRPCLSLDTVRSSGLVLRQTRGGPVARLERSQRQLCLATRARCTIYHWIGRTSLLYGLRRIYLVGLDAVFKCACRADARFLAQTGAYTVIFLTALYLLLWRRPSGVSWTLIIPLVVLYTLATSVQSHRALQSAHPVAL